MFIGTCEIKVNIILIEQMNKSNGKELSEEISTCNLKKNRIADFRLLLYLHTLYLPCQVTVLFVKLHTF